MFKPMGLATWLDTSRDDEVVLRHPLKRIRDLRERATQYYAGIKAYPDAVSRLALDADNAYELTAQLLAILAANATPILFADHTVGWEKFKDTYDAVLSPEGGKTFPRPVIGPEDTPASPNFSGVDSSQVVRLYTSGSTGDSKAVNKTVAQLDAEGRITGALFGKTLKNIEGLTVLSTVDAHHLYGLTFNVWMPMSCGLPIALERVRFPENLSDTAGPIALMTTPTFLRHLDPELAVPDLRFVLSAAGKLEPTDVKGLFDWSGAVVNEIYGSTETGAIASREHTEGLLNTVWTLVPETTLEEEPEGWRLTGPLVEGGSRLLDDNLKTLDATHFELIGRKDRIAKIGEVRISLTEIERVIEAQYGFEVRAMVVKQKGRDAIGVVVNGEKSPTYDDTQTQAYRQGLVNFLEPLALPRFWRYVETWPVNAQGKISVPVLQSLFV